MLQKILADRNAKQFLACFQISRSWGSFWNKQRIRICFLLCNLLISYLDFNHILSLHVTRSPFALSLSKGLVIIAIMVRQAHHEPVGESIKFHLIMRTGYQKTPCLISKGFLFSTMGSLRNQSLHQIQRVDGLSNDDGSVGRNRISMDV